MVFIGQQIIKLMQDQGWDAVIFEVYRSPEKQRGYRRDGTTKAPAWSSPHQYWLAVDIVQRTAKKKYHWPPADDRFWEDLSAAVKVVSEKFGIPLVHGRDWGWDSAHIEYEHFRTYRKRFYKHVLNSGQLADIFQELLPDVWKQHMKSKTYQTKQK